MSLSPIARADAAFQEQIHAQWRDWRAYLRAHLTLLDAQSAERQGAFERADSLEDQAAQAQHDLGRLPAGQRALFDQIREARRQQAQIAAESTAQNSGSRLRLVDPDAVDRQVLLELLAEAEGTAAGAERQDGWGDVPLTVDGAVQWYRVNVAALLEAPTAATYAAGRADADDIRRRIVLSGALVVGMIIFLLVWFLWPRGPARLVALRDPVPTGNGAAIDVWLVRALQLTAANGEAWTVPISATREPRWPSSEVASDAPLVGYWRATAFAPLVVCVPEKNLAGVTSIRLSSGGDVPDRIYAVSAAHNAAIDLVVEPCQPGSDTAGLTRYGSLKTTSSLKAIGVGESAALPGNAHVTVQAIDMIGPGQDPTLPPNTARVLVRVPAPNLDWPAFAPTLLLASGEAVQSPEQTTTADGVELRYLVPLPAADLSVAWSITLPGTNQVLRWRTTLAPPPGRDTVVRAALSVREVKALAPEHPGAGFVLRVTLANTSDQPLQLTRDDVTLTQGTSELTIPDLPGLRSPLAPDETRTLDLPLPDETLSSPLVLTVGASRFQIAR